MSLGTGDSIRDGEDREDVKIFPHEFISIAEAISLGTPAIGSAALRVETVSIRGSGPRG
jgi:hypothetical protein